MPIHAGSLLYNTGFFGAHNEYRDSGFMNRNEKQSPATSDAAGSHARQDQSFILGLSGVRYQVKDVSRSIAFYTEQLGFKLDHQNLPAFGQVSVGNLKLILSGPGASGSRLMADGDHQQPGGWNRVILQVNDVAARIAEVEEGGTPLPQRDGSRPWR